jgi:nucleotide-binding universal stress UspA family protein
MAFRNILYPTDLLKEPSSTIPYALSLAAEYGANLTLLHVLPEITATYPGAEALKMTFRDQMQRLIPTDTELRRKPEFVIGLGDTVETILRISKERQADLIVLGVKKADPLASHLQGNITYRIVTGAECPVLVVRDQF